MFSRSSLVSLRQFLLVALGLGTLWGLWSDWFYLTTFLPLRPRISFIIRPPLSKCQSRGRVGKRPFWSVGHCRTPMWALVFADWAYLQSLPFDVEKVRRAVLWGGVWPPFWAEHKGHSMIAWWKSYKWRCWGQWLKARFHSVRKGLPGSLVKTQFFPQGQRKEENIPSHLRRGVFDRKSISFWRAWIKENQSSACFS